MVAIIRRGGKLWMLNKCSRNTIIKRILKLIRKKDIKTLNSMSGKLGKDYIAKEQRKDPKDTTNLEQLRQVIQIIQGSCGQNAYLPLRLLSVLFEGWNANTCIRAAKTYLGIQVPKGNITANDKYANILKTLEFIFQDYLDKMEGNKSCNSKAPPTLLPKVSGIKKQAKTAHKNSGVATTRKNCAEHYFKRSCSSNPACNSKEAASTTSNTRKICHNNVLNSQNTARDIEIKWRDNSSEIVNVEKWETKLEEKFPCVNAGSQELTFSEEDNVVDFLDLALAQHRIHIQVSSSSTKLRKIGEKLGSSGSFLRCDQFPNRLVIVPVTEHVCQIIESFNTSEKWKTSKLAAIYFNPTQPLRLAATSNSI